MHKYVQGVNSDFAEDFQIKRSRLRRRYATDLTRLLHAPLILFKLLFLVIV